MCSTHHQYTCEDSYINKFFHTLTTLSLSFLCVLFHLNMCELSLDGWKHRCEWKILKCEGNKYKKNCVTPHNNNNIKKHFAILYIEKCLSVEILVQSRERRRLLCGIYGNKLCVHEKSLRVELC